MNDSDPRAWEYGVRTKHSHTEYWNEANPQAESKKWGNLELIRRRPAGPVEVVLDGAADE